MFKRLLVLAFAFATCGGVAAARDPGPVTQSSYAESNGAIAAINKPSRAITITYDDGSTDNITVAPEVTFFDQLVVGQRVHFRATSSIVYAVANPNALPPPTAHTLKLAPGNALGGTMSDSHTVIVTVQAIDPDPPALTVVDAAGKVKTYPVANARNIKGLSVGDKIAATYTDTVTVKIDPPPASK
jgi:hypothetical protein